MKKIIAICLAVVLAVTLALAGTIFVSAGSGDPQIVVSNVSTVKGGTVDVKISLKNNPGVASIRLDVAFPSDLTLVSFGDDTTPNGNNVTDPDPEPGENAKLWVNYNVQSINGYGQQPFTPNESPSPVSPVTLIWVSIENVSGDVDFATLKFKVDDEAALGDKNITVTYTTGDICALDATDQNVENDVDFEIVNGKITVAEGVKGDVTGDGKVKLNDVTMIKKYIAGGYGVTINESLADVTGDGKVKLNDVTKIKKYIAGGYGVTLD